MNYAYQAAGLRRNSGPAEVDLSNVVHGLTADGKVNEANVFDGLLTPAAVYRSAWYVLLAPGTLGETLGIQAAKKHCDGSVLQPGEPGTVPGAPGVGRVDATTVSSLIDWRGDGGTTTSGAQDVNFDGIQGTLDGFDDWSAIRLNQVGAGRNMAGMSIGMEWGGVDWNGVDWNGVDWNGVDWNGVDWNGVDWNGVDWNGVDWNGVDWNGVDWNGVDWNGVDWNGVDWNGVDWNGVDWNGVANGAELDRRTAIDSGGGTAPNDLKAFVRGTDGAGGSHASVPPGETWVPPGEPANCTTLGADQCHQVRLDWSAGHVGPPTSYAGLRVWDSTGTADIPAGGGVAVPVGTTSNGNTTTLNDTEELPNGKRFIYFARATIDGALRSASNFAIVTAENSAPVASNDSYSVPTTGPRTISGNVLNNDADHDSPAAMLKAVLVSGPTGGTLLFNADGSFTYTANATFVGTDRFTYKVNNGTWSRDPSVKMSEDSNIATVTINVPLVYGFVNVQNLAPPAGKTFKRGSNITLKWQFTAGGVPVDSSNAGPVIRITGPNGTATYSQQEPGHSVFKAPSASNGWTWQFNWQSTDESTQQALPQGTYTVQVYSTLTNQTFPMAGTITITLVK